MTKKLTLFVVFDDPRPRHAAELLSNLVSTSDLEIQVIAVTTRADTLTKVKDTYRLGVPVVYYREVSQNLHVLNQMLDEYPCDYTAVCWADDLVEPDYYPRMVAALESSGAFFAYPNVAQITPFKLRIRPINRMPVNPTLHSLQNVLELGGVVRTDGAKVFDVPDAFITCQDYQRFITDTHGFEQTVLHVPELTFLYRRKGANAALVEFTIKHMIKGASGGPAVPRVLDSKRMPQLDFRFSGGLPDFHVVVTGTTSQRQLDRLHAKLHEYGYLRAPQRITYLHYADLVTPAGAYSTVSAPDALALDLSYIFKEFAGKYVLVMDAEAHIYSGNYIEALIGAMQIQGARVAGGLWVESTSLHIHSLGYERVGAELVSIGEASPLSSRGPQGAYMLPHNVSVCAPGLVMVRPHAELTLNQEAGRAWFIDLCAQYPGQVVTNPRCLYELPRNPWVDMTLTELDVVESASFIDQRYYTTTLMEPYEGLL